MDRYVGLLAASAVLSGLLSLGCGSSPKPAPKEPERTAEQRACGHYGVRIAPFLDRFGAALDTYDANLDRATDDTARGEAARAFADFIAGELQSVRAILPRDPTLGPAHDRLVGALEEASAGLDQLATAYALGDRSVRTRALGRIAKAFGEWSAATQTIVAQCRDESPDGPG